MRQSGIYKLKTSINQFDEVEVKNFELYEVTSITTCDKFIWFLIRTPNSPQEIMVYIKDGIRRSELKVNKLTSK